MTKYERIAKDFCKKHGVTVAFRLLGNEINANWKETHERPHYKVTIKRAGRQMTVEFWDSIFAKETGTTPTEYDIFACLEKYDVWAFLDFCRDYCLDDDSIMARNLWKACKREYNALCRVFTPEQLDELREIN